MKDKGKLVRRDGSTVEGNRDAPKSEGSTAASDVMQTETGGEQASPARASTRGNNNLGWAGVRVMQAALSLSRPHTDAAQPLNHDQGCQKWKHGAVSRTSQGRARDTGETGQIGRPSQLGANVRVHSRNRQ